MTPSLCHALALPDWQGVRLPAGTQSLDGATVFVTEVLLVGSSLRWSVLQPCDYLIKQHNTHSSTLKVAAITAATRANQPVAHVDISPYQTALQPRELQLKHTVRKRCTTKQLGSPSEKPSGTRPRNFAATGQRLRLRCHLSPAAP